jgi:[glutamine synthetase] adenylyltransferase / [glutamine synthetase]-adenylyl-L-tyrosine phosphorylase
MAILLQEVPFRDRARALEHLSGLLEDAPAALQERVRSLLKSAPDPDGSSFFLGRLYQERRDDCLRLMESLPGLQVLIAVFSHSHFLAHEVLQHPEWVDELTGSNDLFRMVPADELRMRLETMLGGAPDELPSAHTLALFRRQQILRIAARDVMQFCTLGEATEELSNLADTLLEVTYQRIRNYYIARHGTPLYEDQSTAENRECGFSVIALGKLGGQELNYSSDIDLMFVYAANGQTNGQDPISNKEFFKKVANRFTDLLSTYTPQGLCYRVDLRLRPDGRLGEVCLSLEGTRTYYQKRARDWELQMLIKARVAAGEAAPGRELLDFVEPLTYRTTLDFNAVESVSATRERINEKVAMRRGDFDIKLARGGIRDIEFLVQCLQRLHGGRDQWLRHGGTVLALSRLRHKNYLSDSEYSRLACAYQFLRDLEHRLQMLEDRQTHSLPSERAELELLAKRMPTAEIGSEASADRLLNQLNEHLEDVQGLYERVIHAQQPLYYSGSPMAAPYPRREAESQAAAAPAADAYPEPAGRSNLVRFLDAKSPDLAAHLANRTLGRGHRPFEHFLEKIIDRPEHLGLLGDDAVLAGYAFDLFEHSPYFAEEFIRHPNLLEELVRLRGGQAPETYGQTAGEIEDMDKLRAFYRRETVYIHAGSICLKAPIFQTLEKSSELADAMISAAYRMAVADTVKTHPPEDPTYIALDQMMVISLGRLGMKEFDLASDADLLFVLPDADAPEQGFWIRAAERLIDLLTAYTGGGVMFAVDTRLRPNGRSGGLVQLESTYKEYFAKKAEAWEGIAYMKSRGVAGNIERATRFLNELQQVDWRRWGQSGRSRQDLKQMRARVEKEQASGNPLKAGIGGYFDIDFALLYLRLKGAGIFYRVLNTPERIDVVEQMGHLEREDADFLRDAAIFYRAVDHGLRVYTGHAEGTLPTSDLKLAALTELVHRWTPAHLNGEPLGVVQAHIRTRTRNFFDRLFN